MTVQHHDHDESVIHDIELSPLMQPNNNNNNIAIHNTPFIVTFVERFGIHYGWFVLPVAGLYYYAAVPGMTFGVGFYNEFFITELNMTRSAVSTCWTTALILSSITIPLCGILLDRYGARRVAFVSIIPYTLLLMASAYVNGPISLTVCMFGLRWFMALLELLAQWLTNNWFVKRKGIAMTITAIVGASSLMYPNVLQLFANTYGYRGSYIAQAVLWCVCLCILSPLLVDRPEYANRLPDAVWNATGSNSTVQPNMKRHNSDIELQPLNDSNGGDIVHHDNSILGDDVEIHWHYMDALKTRMFFVVSLATACIAMFWAGFNMDYMSMLSEQGIDESYAPPLFILIAIGDCGTQLVMGVIFDRLYVKARGIAVGTLCCCIATMLLMSTHTITQACIFAIVYGIQDGVLMVGYTTVFSYAFGRAHLGKIDSIAAAIYTGSCGIGPILFGLVKDYTGSYHAVYIGMAICALLMSIALLFETKPTPPPAERLLKLDDHSG